MRRRKKRSCNRKKGTRRRKRMWKRNRPVRKGEYWSWMLESRREKIIAIIMRRTALGRSPLEADAEQEEAKRERGERK